MGGMMANKPTLYPHRRNEDGSYDSICPACFATVARSTTEFELTEYEKTHICDSSFIAERDYFSRAEIMRHPGRFLGVLQRDLPGEHLIGHRNTAIAMMSRRLLR
jgi:hypothetical protein